jgi:hypothetical protein
MNSEKKRIVDLGTSWITKDFEYYPPALLHLLSLGQ